jgi:hypothetical protein
VTGATTGRKFAIGCLTFVFGGASGSMIGVLFGKIVAFLTRAPSCAGLPFCDWAIWAGVGAVLGAVSLSALSVWAVSKPKQVDETK